MAVTLELKGDWQKAGRALRRLGQVNWRALHEEIGELLVSSTRDRFRRGIGPDGKPWKPSVRARKEGGQTLRDTGLLANSIHYAADSRRVEVGTNDKRARVHQEGMTIRPKRAKWLRFRLADQWVTRRQVTVPARPFLGISSQDEQTIDETLRRRIEEALG